MTIDQTLGVEEKGISFVLVPFSRKTDIRAWINLLQAIKIINDISLNQLLRFSFS